MRFFRVERANAYNRVPLTTKFANHAEDQLENACAFILAASRIKPVAPMAK